ncbi:MAG: hypothetical protein IKB81_02865 [Paludibacteraceae bacterium]|nr:hypothetical protein [Paludibacteraceae bacterium]
MRKVSILLVVALIATSCAVGTYHPYARNNFGAQSTVVLDKANFRVVRDVEAIVDVNNTNLSRADVASSAYGELLRKAQLTGSQVLINVVIEEVRRESAGFFRLLFGMPKRVQHVAARATIIEFLDENGNPTVSESYRPTNTHTTTVTAQPIKNSSTNVSVQEVETTNSQPTSPMASAEDIQKCEQVHKQIAKLVKKAQNVWNYKYNDVFSRYNNVIYSFQHNLTEENIKLIAKIQSVVLNYIDSDAKAYPTLKEELKNAFSTEAEIAVFLSYYKEQ